MFNTIRKNQRILMLIVVVLTIVAFTVFYTHTGSVGFEGAPGVVSVYQRVLTQEEIELLVEKYRLAAVLGFYDLLESLGGTVRNETAALNNFVFNQLIIEHESQTLGVQPRDDQVAKAITERSIFQTDGRFDPTRYENFIKLEMAPRGLSERQVEDVVREALRVARVREIVTGSVAVSDQDIRNAFRGYQKQDLEVVKFDLTKYLGKAQVTEEQVKSVYKKNAANLSSPEMRAVNYVVFEIPPDKSVLEGKERVQAVQAVADQAASFAESLSNKKVSLTEAAKEAGLTAYLSQPFDRAGQGNGTEEFHGDLPPLASAVFRLTKEHPYSDALESPTKTRFYVFELASVQPPRPLTIDEARSQLLEELQNQAATKLLFEEGRVALASISEQLHRGRSLQEAAAEAGGSVEEIPHAILYSSSSPEDALYSEIALLLSPGQISALQPSSKGAFAVFLKRREAADPADLAKVSASLKAQLLKNKQNLLFLEWLQGARKAANIRGYQSRS